MKYEKVKWLCQSKRNNILKFILIILVVSFLTCGCSSPSKTKTVKLVWPSPPDDPKIVYLISYKGESNFKKKSWFDILLGESFLTIDIEKPYGVTAFKDKVYITDTKQSVVFVIDIKQKKVTFIGRKGPGKLNLPVGVAVSANNIVFVSDAMQRRIFGYGQDGKVKIAIGKKNEFKRPAGLAINKKLNRLYIVDSYGHKVHVYSTDKGLPLFTFGKRGIGNGDFNYPSNAAIDRRNGNIYVSDTQNFRVQVFDKNGKFITKFGEICDRPGCFARPKGIGIDSDGHVYVVDAAFDNMQIFDENGQVLLFIGGSGNSPGYFWLPAGAYVDEDDKIYIVDPYNHRVQVFQYLKEEQNKSLSHWLIKLSLFNST